ALHNDRPPFRAYTSVRQVEVRLLIRLLRPIVAHRLVNGNLRCNVPTGGWALGDRAEPTVPPRVDPPGALLPKQRVTSVVEQLGEQRGLSHEPRVRWQSAGVDPH